MPMEDIKAYFVLTEVFRVIVLFPFDTRTVTTFLLPTWLTDLVAIEDTRLILSPPFAGMKESYGPGGGMGKCP